MRETSNVHLATKTKPSTALCQYWFPKKNEDYTLLKGTPHSQVKWTSPPHRPKSDSDLSSMPFSKPTVTSNNSDAVI
jgi:hypothetical protein